MGGGASLPKSTYHSGQLLLSSAVPMAAFSRQLSSHRNQPKIKDTFKFLKAQKQSIMEDLAAERTITDDIDSPNGDNNRQNSEIVYQSKKKGAVRYDITIEKFAFRHGINDVTGYLLHSF